MVDAMWHMWYRSVVAIVADADADADADGLHELSRPETHAGKKVEV